MPSRRAPSFASSLGTDRSGSRSGPTASPSPRRPPSPPTALSGSRRTRRSTSPAAEDGVDPLLLELLPGGDTSSHTVGCYAAMMRYLAGLALVFWSMPCGKEPRPQEADATAPSFGPAVFHAQACPLSTNVPQNPLSDECRRNPCKPDEYCNTSTFHGRPVVWCEKKPSCESDADCDGGVCKCGSRQCIAGNCRGSDDCGGRDCAVEARGGGQFCRTKDDECTIHAECRTGHACTYDSGKWTLPPRRGSSTTTLKWRTQAATTGRQRRRRAVSNDDDRHARLSVACTGLDARA